MRLVGRQERKFTNRFGKLIYEDLLHLVPDGDPIDNTVEFGRAVGIQLLKEALGQARGEVRQNIEDALRDAFNVTVSPLFSKENGMVAA